MWRLRARRGSETVPSRSIFGARLRNRVPQYGHSVMYGLTSLPQFLQTTLRSGICAIASTILGPRAHVLSITSGGIRSSGVVAPRPADFQSVNLHVRHARFTARVVQVRGAETTLAVPRGLPAAARPLPAEAEMSFEHDRQIVMLSGTLLGGDDISARFRIDDGIAPRELRRFARLAVSLPVAVTPLTDDGREAGPAEEMHTVDISAGGVLLDRQGMAGAVRVELDLPGGYGAIKASGRIVRNVADGSGVSFEGLDTETLDLVDRFVLGVRHQLAQRFAQAGG
jgi:hypothetical protein